LRIQSLDPTDNADRADEFRNAVGPAVSLPGDLWLLGEHRVYCGSALDPLAYELLMANERASAVFTDAPYNVKIDGNVCGSGAVKHREFAMASGEMTREEFARFLAGAFDLARAYASPGAIIYACMDWRHMAEMIAAGDSANFELLNLCVWVKTNGGMGSLYRSRHELVFVFRNGGEAHRNNVQLGRFGRNRTNVWNYPGANVFKRNGRKSDLDLHPTVKPIAMVADAILDSTNLDDVILDPFLGSGTTLLAAERARRRMPRRRTRPALRRYGHHTLGALNSATSAPVLGPVLRRRQEREEREVSAPDNAYEVGYGRPPTETRWKKGQSGNAGPKRSRAASVGTIEIIDRLFGEPVEVVESGVARAVSTLEAILMRLWAAEMTGSKRAGRVRLEFQELVPKNDRTREILIEEINRQF
jgi:DNA modification methylase